VAAPLADLRAAWRHVCGDESRPQGYDAPYADRGEVDRLAGQGASAYGEILPGSAARLLGWLALTEDDVLYDLGSGVGKLVLQAACTTPVGRAVGVELSEFRHAAAEELLAALLARLEPAAAAALRARVELRKGDLRQADLPDATVVYAGSTSYPDPLLAALAERARSAPRLRALISTRPLPDPTESRYRERARFKSPMSWSSHERLFVYERR
jgi:riboflavin synthase